VGFGRQKDAAITPDADGNARDAQWWGVSGLAAYKLDPRLEAVIRADYINNQKNGGGLLGYTGYYDGAGTVGDGRNGIGISPNCTLGADCKGANRTAIAMGFNYLLTANTTIKAEYRLDLASQAVFFDAKTGTYKKNNSLLGATMVVGF
jgi:acetyltransferase-like isoleucine patch superfamily enzyme